MKASKVEDISAPFVWAINIDVTHKDIVKITNLDNQKAIWVEVYIGTDNFIENYNKRKKTKRIDSKESLLVVNEHYRQLLGVEKNVPVNLSVETTSCCKTIKTFLMSRYHPDTNVNLAHSLGVISLFLGVISLFLSVVSLCSNSKGIEPTRSKDIDNYTYTTKNISHNEQVRNIEYIATVDGFSSGSFELPKYNWSKIQDKINNGDVLFIIVSGFSDPQKVKEGINCDNNCLASQRASQVAKKIQDLLDKKKPVFETSNGLNGGVKLFDFEVAEFSSERKVKIYLGVL
ncbi:hypothetical protein GNP84_16350 [Aliivibrio fischeri]|uniref:hypothetical protein n=1 Tax=Aliivibrio fischeri TaxID=668 RepID=UPI0012D9BB77|nr:hypothetical protein [Aliivibrio fischeri]MUK78455.1 hypothetical protein [Aliivibrio fischeri]